MTIQELRDRLQELDGDMRVYAVIDYAEGPGVLLDQPRGSLVSAFGCTLDGEVLPDETILVISPRSWNFLGEDPFPTEVEA